MIFKPKVAIFERKLKPLDGHKVTPRLLVSKNHRNKISILKKFLNEYQTFRILKAIL
jgi:hypothetical protein